MSDQNKDSRREEENQKNKMKQQQQQQQQQGNKGQNKAGQLLADRENEKQNKSERHQDGSYDQSRSH